MTIQWQLVTMHELSFPHESYYTLSKVSIDLEAGVVDSESVRSNNMHI